MPDSTPAAYTIVPWVRRGLGSLITAQPSVNFASLPVTLSVNNTSVNGPQIRLIGPGQITALDARAVVRTEPRDGATAFEPNYFPMVELAMPDLPWMFTPTPPNGGRLQPWICLVVVPDTDGIVLDSSSGGISVLRVDSPANPKVELPDLSTVDLWTHAQVTGGELSGAALNSALNGDPSATVSRLVAPRVLTANTAYIACVVPTYRAGLNAALGLPVNDSDLAPAWDVSVSAGFTLPVYYAFRFQTGAGGDFASLAEKIAPPKNKLEAGTRNADFSQPGFGATGVPSLLLGVEGALRTIGTASTPWPAGAQAAYESQLRAVLAPASAGDPVLAPPTYGNAQSGAGLPEAGAAPIWLSELNLDPRERVAASVGAEVVRDNQEALVSSAWEQFGEIRKANELLQRGQLARQVSQSLSARHLQRVAGNGEWLQITAPLHSRIRIALGGVTGTLYGQLQTSRLPAGALSSAMRRIARPDGLIGRQLKSGVPQIVERLNMPAGSAPTALQVAGPLQNPPGMVAFDAVSSTVHLEDMTATSVASAGGWTLANEVAAGQLLTSTASAAVRVETPVATNLAGTELNEVTPVKPILIDWQTNPNLPPLLKGARPSLPTPVVFPTDTAALELVQTNFRKAAESANTYLNISSVPPPDAPPLGGQADLTPLRAQAMAVLDPANTLRARIGARIPLNPGPDPLQPIDAGPSYPQAMYAPLAQLSSEWMLPGISNVEPDCATLLAPNPEFVESYMVGLNEEMARVLLWREFPGDRRATFFQSFWAGERPDIPSISTFDGSAHLGSHVDQGETTDQFFLLIRSTLFQRYPNAMVYAAQAAWSGRVRILTDNVQFPLFRGDIGTDIKFFAFEVSDPTGTNQPTDNRPGWYFVLAEHVTEPRAGLEPAKSTTPTGLWNDLSWQEVTLKGNYVDATVAPPTPANETIAWSANSAALAYIVIRRPVRVAMHGLALLGGS